MSDIEPQPEDQPQGDGPRELRDALARERQRATEAEQRASDADGVKRENVMLRAGVDIDSDLGKLFSKGYEGDLDVAVVKEAWAKLTPPSDSVQVEPSPADVDAQAQRNALGADAPPPAQLTEPDPKRAGLEEFHRLRAEEGYTSEEAAVQAFDKLITAANNGDKRVLWDNDAKRDFYERTPNS